MDPAPSLAPTPARGIWTSLRYRGTSFLARFSAEIEMQSAAGRSVRPAGSAGHWLAELRTELGSFLLKDKSTRLRAYFDPQSAAVGRLTQLSLGPSPDFKRYAFEPPGVSRIRTEPGADDPLDEPEAWPDRPPEVHAYDAASLGCSVVSSPAALVWWLTWGPGARSPHFPDVGACHFLGRTLYRIEIRALGSAEDGEVARVDYQLLHSAGRRRRLGHVPIERYEIVSRPIAGKLDEKTMIAEIVLDAENRLPWRFKMREGPFRIDVELERAVLGSVPTIPAPEDEHATSATAAALASRR